MKERKRGLNIWMLIEDMFSPRGGGGLTPVFSLMKHTDLCQDLQKHNLKIDNHLQLMGGGGSYSIIKEHSLKPELLPVAVLRSNVTLSSSKQGSLKLLNVATY